MNNQRTKLNLKLSAKKTGTVTGTNWDKYIVIGEMGAVEVFDTEQDVLAFLEKESNLANPEDVEAEFEVYAVYGDLRKYNIQAVNKFTLTDEEKL